MLLDPMHFQAIQILSEAIPVFNKMASNVGWKFCDTEILPARGHLVLKFFGNKWNIDVPTGDVHDFINSMLYIVSHIGHNCFFADFIYFTDCNDSQFHMHSNHIPKIENFELKTSNLKLKNFKAGFEK